MAEFGGVARVTAPGATVAMATSRSLGDFHFKRGYNSCVFFDFNACFRRQVWFHRDERHVEKGF